MGKRKDYTGVRFGRRTVLGPAPVNEHSANHPKGKEKPRAKWLWQCDCGAQGSSPIRNIRKQTYCKACPDCPSAKGVAMPSRVTDRTGVRNGSRVILGPADTRVSKGRRQYRWQWRCDCGREGETTYFSFQKYPACAGCLAVGGCPIGKLFGTKKVLSWVEHVGGGASKWRWRCEVCGAEGVSMLRHLRRSADVCRCKNAPRTARNACTRIDGRLVLLEAFVGQTIGKRTVLDVDLVPRGNRHRTVHWVCACGKEGHSRLGYLQKHERCSFCRNRQLVFGKWMNYQEMAKLFDMHYSTLHKRLNKEGMLLEEALLRPLWEKGKGQPGVLRKDHTGEMLGSRTLVEVIGIKSSSTLYRWRCRCGHEGVGAYANIQRLSPCFYCAGTGQCASRVSKKVVAKERTLPFKPVLRTPKPLSVTVGQRFGTIVVTGEVPPTEQVEGRRWRWRCDVCGTTGVTKRPQARCYTCTPRKSPCTSMMVIGQRFGTRVVIDEIPAAERDHNRRWRWRCDRCGKEGLATHYGLQHRACVGCRKRLFQLGGKTWTLVELAKEYGVNRNTLYTRLERGLSIEEAITIPVNSRMSQVRRFKK